MFAANIAVKQQLNIIDSNNNTGANSASLILIDTNAYNGATYYFEVDAQVTSGTGTASLIYNAGNGATPSGGTTLTISNIAATSYTRYRSSAFTPSGAQNAYFNGGTGAGISINGIRIVVIQSAPALTNTVSQIEMGQNGGLTNATDSVLGSPKYWKFDGTKYDGTVKVYFEASLKNSTAGDSVSASLYPAGSTCSGQVSGSEVTSDTTGGNNRVRSGDILANLVNGTTYMVCMRYNTGGTANMRNAKMIIQQTATGGITKLETQDINVQHNDTTTSNTYVPLYYQTQYSPSDWAGGSFAYYFEANVDTNQNTESMQLYDITDSLAVVGSTISTTSTTVTNLVRSSALTMPAVTVDITAQLNNSGTGVSHDRGSWLIIDVTNLPHTPNAPTTFVQTTFGGNLAASTTYYYRISVSSDNGESLLSTASSITTGAGSNNQNTITWNSVNGINYYTLYRGIGSATMTQTIQTTSTSFIDDGNQSWQNYKPNNEIATWNGTSGIAISGTQLPRYGASAATFNGYIYELGGTATGTTGLASVYYSKINSTGTIGTWAATTSLPQNRFYGCAAAANGFLYYLTGTDDGTTQHAELFYNTINADGTIGASWTTNATSSPKALFGSSCVATNTAIYEMGGSNAGGIVKNVYYTFLNSATGAASAWQSSATYNLPGNYEYGSAVIQNGYIFYLGGTADGTTGATVVFTNKINASGNLTTSWTTAGNATQLPQGIFKASAVVANNTIYLLGGTNGTSAQNSVFYAKINKDKNNPNANDYFYESANTLALPLHSMSATTFNGTIQIIGGNSGTSAVNTSYFTQTNTPNNNYQLQSTATTTALSSGLFLGNTVAYNGYLYEIGGTTNGTSGLTSVSIAAINTNGTIGSWSANANPLPTGLFLANAAAYNGYMYVLGGTTNNTSGVNTVYYAIINANGTIGTWNTTTSLNSALFRGVSFANNGFMYYLTGTVDNLAATSASYYATINANGTLSAWTATTSVPSNFFGAYGFSYNNYAYIGQGLSASGTGSRNFYSAVINTNGTIGALTLSSNLSQYSSNYQYANAVCNGTLYMTSANATSGTGSNWTIATHLNLDGTNSQFKTTAPFGATTNIYYSSLATYNNYIYEVGGTTNGTSGLTAVNYTQCLSGTTNSFAATTSLSSTLFAHGTAMFNNFLYAIGGNNGTSAISSITYAKMNQDGTIGGWKATVGINGSTALQNISAYAFNGYLYVIGGTNNGTSGVNTVFYAPINLDGSLGAWTTNANSLPTSLFSTSATIFNNYLYVVGGTTNGTSGVNTIFYAPVNADGSIGTWVTNTATLPASLFSGTLLASNNYLYYLGGASSATAGVNTVYSALINANGSIAAPTSLTTVLPSALFSGASVIRGGWIYYLGGTTNGSTPTGTIYFAQLLTKGVLGSWLQNPNSLSTAVFSSGVVTSSGYIYAVGGTTNGTAGTISVTNAQIYDQPGVNFSCSAYCAQTFSNSNIVTWSSVAGATGYRIYRCTCTTPTSGNLYAQVNGGNTTKFLDTGGGYTTSGSYSAGSPGTSTLGTVNFIPSGGSISFGGNATRINNYYYSITVLNGGVEGALSTPKSWYIYETSLTPPSLTLATNTNAPSSILTASWQNQKFLTLGGTVSSPNASDSLSLLIEVEPVGTAFTNTLLATSFVTSGNGVYQSSVQASTTGNSYPLTVPITGLNSSTQYIWQINVLGNNGYGGWNSGQATNGVSFGIDAASPLPTQQNDAASQGVTAAAFSAQPAAFFSDNFESGTLLTTDAPAGQWGTKSGSVSVQTKQNFGGTFDGTNGAKFTLSPGSTSQLSKNITGVKSEQLSFNIFLQSNSLVAGSHINIATIASGGSNTTIALNPSTLGNASYLSLSNSSAGTCCSSGTSQIVPNKWYAIELQSTLDPTNGSMALYLNGVLETSVTNINTGSIFFTSTTIGPLYDSAGTNSGAYIYDNVRVENMTGITRLGINNGSAYSYANPYFEFYGENDLTGSGIASYPSYFGTTYGSNPTTILSTDSYSPTTLASDGLYYFFFLVKDNLGNTSLADADFTYLFQNITAPSSLNQFKADGTTLISNGAWTSDGVSTNVILSLTMSSPNLVDTLFAQVEVEPNGTAFTGIPNYTGGTTSYTGTAVIGTVNVTGLTNCTGYHWQAFTANANGYGQVSIFNATNPNFSVQNTGPIGGSVFDGTTNNTEISNNLSLTTIAGNWTGFSDSCSGLAAAPYQVSVGTTIGGTDIVGYTQSGITLNNPNPYNTFGSQTLSLQTGVKYYVNVKATNIAGATTILSSPGQSVSPMLSFSLVGTGAATPTSTTNAMNITSASSTASQVAFGSFLPGTNAASLLMQTTTNAGNGYTLYLEENQSLTSGVNTISNVTSNTTWVNGTTVGFGVNVTGGTNSDANTTIFTANSLFMPIPINSTSLILASRLNPTNSSGDSEYANLQVGISNAFPNGSYSNTISYVVLPNY